MNARVCYARADMEFRIPRDEATDRARKVSRLWLDCDGVMTDGTSYFGADGSETKRFNILDGHGIVLWHRVGHSTAVISGRGSAALEQRVAELKIEHLVQRSMNKLEALGALLQSTGASLDEVAYMGDDIVDIPVMRRVGLAIAPANAVTETKEAAHLVTGAGGGQGAIRELIEFVLRTQGRWETIMQRYLV